MKHRVRFLCALLTIVFCFSWETSWHNVLAQTTASDIVTASNSLGDITLDGKINVADYALLKRYVLMTHTLSEQQLSRADVNFDSKVGTADYVLLKRHVMGTFVISSIPTPDIPGGDEGDKTEVHEGIIPNGGTYYVGVKTTALGNYEGASAIHTSGDAFPNTVNTGDVYTYGDYEYRYNYSYVVCKTGEGLWETRLSQKGWGVRVLNDKRAEYSAVLTMINRAFIVDMRSTFDGCTYLTIAPNIPASVVEMSGTFCGCTSLKSYRGSKDEDGDFSGYVIPTGVENLGFNGSDISERIRISGVFKDCLLLRAPPDLSHLSELETLSYGFSGCMSLATPPVIPSNVNDMTCTFENCISLTTAPILPEYIYSLDCTFYGCTMLSTYIGSNDGNGDFSNYQVSKRIRSMCYTFANCDSISAPPDLRYCSSLKSLEGTFENCTSLLRAPAIPSSVNDLDVTFKGCTSLVNASAFVVPKYARQMSATFFGCSSLKGRVTIHATPFYCLDFFSNTQKPIEIVGTCSEITMQRFANTANNGNVTYIAPETEDDNEIEIGGEREEGVVYGDTPLVIAVNDIVYSFKGFDEVAAVIPFVTAEKGLTIVIISGRKGNVGLTLIANGDGTYKDLDEDIWSYNKVVTMFANHWCIDCEKRTGDGTHGTCVHFLRDYNCPECGKFVKGLACHTCESE